MIQEADSDGTGQVVEQTYDTETTRMEINFNDGTGQFGQK